MKILVGLGNFEDSYIGTRHNVGRDFCIWLMKKNKFSEFKKDSFLKALVSTGEINGEMYMLILPETYMNLSGITVKNIFQKWNNTQKVSFGLRVSLTYLPMIVYFIIINRNELFSWIVEEFNSKDSSDILDKS